MRGPMRLVQHAPQNNDAATASDALAVAAAISSDNAMAGEAFKQLWRSPELLRIEDQKTVGRGTQKGDVYSFGIILFEIYGRAGPYGDTLLTSTEIIERVKKNFLRSKLWIFK